MPPPILFLDSVSLTFGGSALLESASLTVESGERLCLVGRNGSGKSTLMKIAAGLVEADSGERFVQPGVTLRYLPQEPDFAGHATVEAYVAAGLAPGDDLHRAQFLIDELQLIPDRAPANLSGGEARRAALARTLAPDPDILLLDEPTNHLDLPMIEWLEQHLRQSRSALVLISHDRRFLQTLSKKTLWLDRGRTRLLEKGFADFEDWRDKLLEEEETARHKLDRKIVREEHWITHGVSGRRRRNMRRLRQLQTLRSERAAARKATGSVAISANAADRSGKLVVELKSVSKSWDGAPVVDGLSTIIQRGERIGLVGPNGAGKTTLIGLITGRIPADAGEIRHGVNVEPLIIDQKREALDPDWSLRQALTDNAGDQVKLGDTRKHVVAYMKDFLFSPEQAGTPVAALSGGERGRLMLARGLRTPSNLLVLDEPTNDLDLETLDLLQEFVADYAGTVIVVSHDRDFLDRICDRVIAAQGNGKWLEFAGGYTDMLAQRNQSESKAGKPVGKPKPPETRTPPATAAAPRLSFKQKHALETLPAEIARLEHEIARLRAALADPQLYEREPKKFQTYATALDERETTLSAKEEEWLELEMLREAGQQQ